MEVALADPQMSIPEPDTAQSSASLRGHKAVACTSAAEVSAKAKITEVETTEIEDAIFAESLENAGENEPDDEVDGVTHDVANNVARNVGLALADPQISIPEPDTTLSSASLRGHEVIACNSAGKVSAKAKTTDAQTTEIEDAGGRDAPQASGSRSDKRARHRRSSHQQPPSNACPIPSQRQSNASPAGKHRLARMGQPFA